MIFIRCYHLVSDGRTLEKTNICFVHKKRTIKYKLSSHCSLYNLELVSIFKLFKQSLIKFSILCSLCFLKLIKIFRLHRQCLRFC